MLLSALAWGAPPRTATASLVLRAEKLESVKIAAVSSPDIDLRAGVAQPVAGDAAKPQLRTSWDLSGARTGNSVKVCVFFSDPSAKTSGGSSAVAAANSCGQGHGQEVSKTQITDTNRKDGRTDSISVRLPEPGKATSEQPTGTLNIVLVLD